LRGVKECAYGNDDAGSLDQPSAAALGAIAAYESRFGALQQKLDRLDERMEAGFHTVNWMSATCITFVVVVIGGQMALWARLGELAASIHRPRR
jgi:hypothetical protein